ncbi:MAG: hypothetical protein RR382_00585 [Tannerellaceae bacterium]
MKTTETQSDYNVLLKLCDSDEFIWRIVKLDALNDHGRVYSDFVMLTSTRTRTDPAEPAQVEVVYVQDPLQIAWSAEKPYDSIKLGVNNNGALAIHNAKENNIVLLPYEAKPLIGLEVKQKLQALRRDTSAKQDDSDTRYNKTCAAKYIKELSYGIEAQRHKLDRDACLTISCTEALQDYIDNGTRPSREAVMERMRDYFHNKPLAPHTAKWTDECEEVIYDEMSDYDCIVALKQPSFVATRWELYDDLQSLLAVEGAADIAQINSRDQKVIVLCDGAALIKY